MEYWESTYDQELIRILRNWLVSYTVTGQWHLTEVDQDEDYVYRYVNIVINGNEENIVLELVATANQSNLEEHFNRALSYGDNLAATAIWIVHFTCEDRYCKAEDPKYQCEEQKIKGLNVAHFWHNEKFDDVYMCACLKDGKIVKRQVIPQIDEE